MNLGGQVSVAVLGPFCEGIIFGTLRHSYRVSKRCIFLLHSRRIFVVSAPPSLIPIPVVPMLIRLPPAVVVALFIVYIVAFHRYAAVVGGWLANALRRRSA